MQCYETCVKKRNEPQIYTVQKGTLSLLAVLPGAGWTPAFQTMLTGGLSIHAH
jgi:hypothetical protein